MKRHLIVKEEAVSETIEAYGYYESEREGLGREFIEILEAYYDKIVDHPYLYQADLNNRRVAFIHRFPYKIVYEVEEDAIVVYAVFHTSRDPETLSR